MTVIRWFVTALLLACGSSNGPASFTNPDNSNACQRPTGTRIVQATLIDGSQCDDFYMDTINFEHDPCLQRTLFDPTMCVWEGSGLCGGYTIVVILDDPTLSYGTLTILDGVDALCYYDVELR